MNTYGYVGGNPVKQFDALGLAYSPVGEHYKASYNLYESAFNYKCKTPYEIEVHAKALAGQVTGLIAAGPAGMVPGGMIGAGVGLMQGEDEFTTIETAGTDALVSSAVKPSNLFPNAVGAAGYVGLDAYILPEGGDPVGRDSAISALVGYAIGGPRGYVAGAAMPWLVVYFRNSLEAENERFGCGCQ